MGQNSEIKIMKDTDYKIQLFFDYFNERLRIDEYRGNLPLILEVINEVIESNPFNKVIYYAKPTHWETLLAKGYELEAKIDGYFNGVDCFLMTFYKDIDRKTNRNWLKEDKILSDIQKNQGISNDKMTASFYSFRRASKQDATQLAKLYDRVFAIYPTPMNDPKYIEKVMDQGTIFHVVECEGKIVSAASAEVNMTYFNAEMTDCATLDGHRGHGLMKQLLRDLEKELKDIGVYNVFSMARSLSFGMNVAFFQLGYEYRGRLTNNCFIFDTLEDMNVWVKDLSNDMGKS